MRASLAAFTSEVVAPRGIPWVELWRIMYRDTRCGRAVTIKTNEKNKCKSWHTCLVAAEKIYAYVLAGGGSTRFGRDKALVEFGGDPLLLQIVRVARSCTDNVTIVGNREKYVTLSPDLQIIADRWPGEGPLGGIITALQHAAATDRSVEWNLILSCDMPFLTTEWLQFLVTHARETSKEIQVILPHSAHGPEPLCACYRTNAADALKNVFDRGVRKVTQALKELRTEVLDEFAWKRFDSAGRLFWNMNTPADFEEAQRLWETPKK
jgi:molybdopterin-guanine dinucleotide biosynthesis protein A